MRLSKFIPIAEYLIEVMDKQQVGIVIGYYAEKQIDVSYNVIRNVIRYCDKKGYHTYKRHINDQSRTRMIRVICPKDMNIDNLYEIPTLDISYLKKELMEACDNFRNDEDLRMKFRKFRIDKGV